MTTKTKRRQHTQTRSNLKQPPKQQQQQMTDVTVYLPRCEKLQKNCFTFRHHVVGIDCQFETVRYSGYVGHKAEECNNSESHFSLVLKYSGVSFATKVTVL